MKRRDADASAPAVEAVGGESIGFVHVACPGRIPPDDIVFLIDVILEELDEIRGVESRNPTAVV